MKFARRRFRWNFIPSIIILFMATCLRHNINTTLFITSKAGGNTQAPVNVAAFLWHSWAPRCLLSLCISNSTSAATQRCLIPNLFHFRHSRYPSVFLVCGRSTRPTLPPERVTPPERYASYHPSATRHATSA